MTLKYSMPQTRSLCRAIPLVLACALAVASCADTHPSPGSVCCSPSPLPTQAGAGFECLSPVTAPGMIGIECQARPELSWEVTGKKISNGALLPIVGGAVKVGGVLAVDIAIHNTQPAPSAAALKIDSDPNANQLALLLRHCRRPVALRS